MLSTLQFLFILTALVGVVEAEGPGSQAARSANYTPDLAINAANNDYERVIAAETYAAMANSAYQEGAEFPVKNQQITGAISGLRARVFDTGKEIVVAFAGTNPLDPRDLRTDVTAHFPTAMPMQFTEADQLVQKLINDNPGKRISVTGHSLGGELALYAGAKHNLDAIAFDAPSPNTRMRREIIAAQQVTLSKTPPLSLSFSGREYLQSRLDNNWGNDQDYISRLVGGYGKLIYVPAGKWPDDHSFNVSYHSMENLLKGIGAVRGMGLKEYEKLQAIWSGNPASASRSTKSSSGSKSAVIPGTDMELPLIDSQGGTTVGGASSPIQLPQVPVGPTPSAEEQKRLEY